jgi:hypothetical protein
VFIKAIPNPARLKIQSQGLIAACAFRMAEGAVGAGCLLESSSATAFSTAASMGCPMELYILAR